MEHRHRDAQADQHYAEHVERDFYPPLRDFVTSGPLVALVLEGDEAIEVVRALNGATDGRKAAPGHHPRRPVARTARTSCTAPTRPSRPRARSRCGSRALTTATGGFGGAFRAACPSSGGSLGVHGPGPRAGHRPPARQRLRPGHRRRDAGLGRGRRRRPGARHPLRLRTQHLERDRARRRSPHGGTGRCSFAGRRARRRRLRSRPPAQRRPPALRPPPPRCSSPRRSPRPRHARLRCTSAPLSVGVARARELLALLISQVAPRVLPGRRADSCLCHFFATGTSRFSPGGRRRQGVTWRTADRP